MLVIETTHEDGWRITIGLVYVYIKEALAEQYSASIATYHMTKPVS
jgi:hypothetical protein